MTKVFIPDNLKFQQGICNNFLLCPGFRQKFTNASRLLQQRNTHTGTTKHLNTTVAGLSDIYHTLSIFCQASITIRLIWPVCAQLTIWGLLRHNSWSHLHTKRGLSGKIADTANKTRNVYPRLKTFCIGKYQLSNTNYTEYGSLFSSNKMMWN